MIRILTLTLFFLAASAALFSQGGRAFLFLAAEPLPGHQQKLVYESLLGLDPRILIGIDGRYVKVRTMEDLSAQQMLDAMEAQGVQLRLPGEVPTAQDLRAGAPLPWVAGAAQADPAAHAAAKEAWIQAHPDAYLQMQQGEAPASERLTPSDQ